MKQMGLIFFLMTFCLNVSAQNKMSDREIRGFKGSVKTVVEDQMLTYTSSGRSKINERVNWAEYYFDRDGKLAQIFYHAFNDKLVFNVIDGFKVFKSSPIKEDKSPKDTAFSIEVGKEEPIEKPEKLNSPDKRFNQRYVYEYDSQGRVKAEREYENNGKLQELNTFKYKKNGRLAEQISNDTVAITKYIFKYDDNDNLIETLEERNVKFGVDRKTKHTYTDYKVDAQGNWTERKQSSTSEMRGETYSTTIIYYRTISYY